MKTLNPCAIFVLKVLRSSHGEQTQIPGNPAGEAYKDGILARDPELSKGMIWSLLMRHCCLDRIDPMGCDIGAAATTSTAKGATRTTSAAKGSSTNCAS